MHPTLVDSFENVARSLQKASNKKRSKRFENLLEHVHCEQFTTTIEGKDKLSISSPVSNSGRFTALVISWIALNNVCQNPIRLRANGSSLLQDLCCTMGSSHCAHCALHKPVSLRTICQPSVRSSVDGFRIAPLFTRSDSVQFKLSLARSL